VDLLEPADQGAGEHQPVGEDLPAEGLGRRGEMLHRPGRSQNLTSTNSTLLSPMNLSTSSAFVNMNINLALSAGGPQVGPLLHQLQKRRPPGAPEQRLLLGYRPLAAL
jgi:hypothetical protein